MLESLAALPASPLAAVRIGMGALIGLVAGSFAATVVLRWPAGRSVARGRSACDGCGVTLTARQLVPLMSYALQRGRCAGCGAAIDRTHPLVEAAAALIGALALLLHPGWHGVAGALFGWALLTLTMLDLRHFWLPDAITLPLLLLGLALGWVIEPPLIDRAIGAVAGYAGLALIALGYARLRRRMGLGMGDAKLFGAIGAWLGWQALPPVLLLASVSGIAIVLVLAIGGRAIGATTRVPFGALLAPAAFLLWLLE